MSQKSGIVLNNMYEDFKRTFVFFVKIESQVILTDSIMIFRMFTLVARFC